MQLTSSELAQFEDPDADIIIASADANLPEIPEPTYYDPLQRLLRPDDDTGEDEYIPETHPNRWRKRGPYATETRSRSPRTLPEPTDTPEPTETPIRPVAPQ